MTSDGEALYAACLDQSSEDTPRLVYADWLDEQGEVRVRCPACEAVGYSTDYCSLCLKSGTVPDRSNAARAELIRVQCALAMLDKPYRKIAQRARERELLAAARTWETLPCPACIRRGGVYENRGRLGHYAEYVTCPVCSSTGDLLLLPPTHRQSTATQRRTVHWTRGFPVVECASAECWRVEAVPDVAEYHEVTTPTPWARAVGRWVTGFRLTDREPRQAGWNIPKWAWEPGIQQHTAFQIPFWLSEPAGWKAKMRGGLMQYEFSTSEVAVAALDAAVAMWVRSHS